MTETAELIARLRKGDAMNGQTVNCRLDQCNCSIMEDAASALQSLQEQNERLRDLSQAVLELASQLEVKGPHGDHVWLHLRPSHKRSTGFCNLRLDLTDPIRS